MATYPASGVMIPDTIAKVAYGKAGVYEIDRVFDTKEFPFLDHDDEINLFQLPAGHVIMAAALAIVTPGTCAATVNTVQLRVTTTALSAALDATVADGVAIGGNATYNLPLVSATAATINLVVVSTTGTTEFTLNPVVRVKLIVADMRA